MKNYILNKNFTLVECQAEAIVYPIDNITQKVGEKETTLYLNKTALLILKQVLDGKEIEEIATEIKKNFLNVEKDNQKLQEQIEGFIKKLEKIGVLVI